MARHQKKQSQKQEPLPTQPLFFQDLNQTSSQRSNPPHEVDFRTEQPKKMKYFLYAMSILMFKVLIAQKIDLLDVGLAIGAITFLLSKSPIPQEEITKAELCAGTFEDVLSESPPASPTLDVLSESPPTSPTLDVLSESPPASPTLDVLSESPPTSPSPDTFSQSPSSSPRPNMFTEARAAKIKTRPSKSEAREKKDSSTDPKKIASAKSVRAIPVQYNGRTFASLAPLSKQDMQAIEDIIGDKATAEALIKKVNTALQDNCISVVSQRQQGFQLLSDGKKQVLRYQFIGTYGDYRFIFEKHEDGSYHFDRVGTHTGSNHITYSRR